jgi:hypothetical protein
MGQATAKCMEVSLHEDTFVLGCESGLITDIPHFGLYIKGSQADKESRCYTKQDDFEQRACLGVSSRSHPLYTEKLMPCLGQKNCLVKNLHKILQSTATDVMGTCKYDVDSTIYI